MGTKEKVTVEPDATSVPPPDKGPDKGERPAPPPEEPKEETKKVTYQFKYRNYREILDIVDPDAEPTPSGKRPYLVIKARNFRLDLDLTQKRDREIHDRLMASKQKGVSFWQVTGKPKDSKAKEQGDTLTKLLGMGYDKLRAMLDDNELEAQGLLPGTPTREQLIYAIITTKRMED